MYWHKCWGCNINPGLWGSVIETQNKENATSCKPASDKSFNGWLHSCSKWKDLTATRIILMEVSFSLNLSETVRKVHTNYSFSDMGQQELACYLRCYPRQKFRECKEWNTLATHLPVVLSDAPSPFFPSSSSSLCRCLMKALIETYKHELLKAQLWIQSNYPFTASANRSARIYQGRSVKGNIVLFCKCTARTTLQHRKLGTWMCKKPLQSNGLWLLFACNSQSRRMW